MAPKTNPMQPSGKVFLVCGLWLIASGLYFLFLRPAPLPENAQRVYLDGET